MPLSFLTPFYTEPGATIYCGDCRKIAPLLPDFDLLLTDPPYGLRDKLQGGTWGKSFDGDYEDWDAVAPPEWTLRMLMAKTHWQIIWGGNYFALPPSRGWLVWNKPERGLTMADAEIAWANLDKNIRVFDSPRNPDGKRVHPTQKPVELMSWCFNQVSEAKTVFDPYMGSGTTLVAAKLRGIKAVGIEANEDYCKLAVARLAQGVLLPC
jgi:DNA modification methylase